MYTYVETLCGRRVRFLKLYIQLTVYEKYEEQAAIENERVETSKNKYFQESNPLRSGGKKRS